MISLAITSYNRFQYTIECFEKVLHDDRIAEVVISDDCSTDNSYDKLCDYFKDEKKVKLYRNEVNVGCAFNKRIAVLLASNRYVVIFDSDNVIDTSYLDVVFDYGWDEDIILQPEYLMPNFDFKQYSGLLLDKHNIAEYIGKPHIETALNAHNFFVNRDNYLMITEGQTDAITSDSIQFAYQWLAANKSIYITPNLWYYHRVHPGSHYQNNVSRTPNGLHESILQQLKNMK